MEISTVVEIETQEQLESLIENNDVVVVDFHAPSWCVPCKRLHPHFVKAAEQIENAVFVTVDVDKAAWASKEYNFMSVPTVKMFSDGDITDIESRTVIQLVSEIGGLT